MLIPLDLIDQSQWLHNLRGGVSGWSILIRDHYLLVTVSDSFWRATGNGDWNRLEVGQCACWLPWAPHKINGSLYPLHCRRVSTLCAEWEAVLLHGVKRSKPKSSLRWCLYQVCYKPYNLDLECGSHYGWCHSGRGDINVAILVYNC